MRLALVATATLLATACGAGDTDPAEDMPEDDMRIVGGPCSYDETVIEAEVIALEEDRIELARPDGEPFYMRVEDFGRAPSPGETFTILWEQITEGTCTPDIYTVMEAEAGGAE